MGTERTFSRDKAFGFFILASLLYVFPIIHADYAYIDDNWRALLWADEAWRNQGRVLAEGVTKFLAFNNASINIFPLPLLMATFVLAHAMSLLTFWFFSQPRWTACLVVLPIFCNPFFLGNISYQYDGPGMMLAVAAAIYALTCNVGSVYLRGVLSALLLAVMLSLYQLTVTVFISLCFVECMWNVRNKIPARVVLLRLVQRVLHLALGGFIYYLTAFQMVVGSRGNFIPLDQHWLEVVSGKFLFSMERVLELVNSGNFYFSILILLVAGIEFIRLGKNIFILEGGRGDKLLVLAVYLLVIPVLIVGIPGAMLLLDEKNIFARNFLGFSGVLFFLFLLNYECLGRVWSGLLLLLIVPVLCMYSLCFAYGQVIAAKKELETALATFIAYDIIATDELKSSKVLFFIGPRTGGNWSPMGYPAMSYMPVLRYILSSASDLLHPQFFPRLGINNVDGRTREVFEAAMSSSKMSKLILDRKFYSIYITESAGFIVMKDIVDSEKYMDDPW